MPDAALGAVYCDGELRVSGMRGENMRSGSVIVTKTHHYGPKWTDLDKPGHLRNNVYFPRDIILAICTFCG